MRRAFSPRRARRTLASESELTTPMRRPRLLSSCNMPSTPGNSAMSAICCALRARMCRAISGNFQRGTSSRSRMRWESRRRRVSTSSGATRRKRNLSATEFITVMNHGKLSASVPSMSKMTSRYFKRDPGSRRSVSGDVGGAGGATGLDRVDQVAALEGLAQAQGGAEIEGLVEEIRHGFAAHRIAGHGDDRYVGGVFAENLDGLQPVHAWHEDIDDEHVERERLDGAHGGVPTLGDHHRVSGAFQDHPDGDTNRNFVVDHEDACHEESLPLIRTTIYESRWPSVVEKIFCHSADRCVPRVRNCKRERGA